MKRSKLSQKFTLHEWNKYLKKFREEYKKEEGKPFKGSIAQYLTIGVIQRNGLPEVDDVTKLIRLGNINCSEEQAETILDAWLQDEENKERGVAGAFCDICNDLMIDISTHPILVEQVNNMEEYINKMQEAKNQFSKIIEQLGTITSKLEENKVEVDKQPVEDTKKLEVETEDTQDNK